MIFDTKAPKITLTNKLTKDNNTETMTTAYLNIKVKTLNSNIGVSFIVNPSIDGNITLLIDEHDLLANLSKNPNFANILKESKIDISKNAINANTKKTEHLPLEKESELLALEEFPHDLVKYVDISEIEILSQPEQALTKYNTNVALVSIIESFINEKKSLEDEAKRNNTTCKTCSIGALNRRYLQKIIPQLPGHGVRLSLYKDIYNVLKCDTEERASICIKNDSLRTINNSYFKELKEAESQPGCTQCKKNGIKVKYLNTLSELINKNRNEIIKTYEH